MVLVETHKVPIIEKPIRLQDYGVNIFITYPKKSGFKKAIKKGLVYVNGKIANTSLFITGNETIDLFEIKEQQKKFHLSLDILFEDDYLAIIYKPAGILVSGNSFATIDNALTQNLQPSTQKDAVRPRPVHRLDYATSGLLLIGKTNASIIALNKLFEHKEIQKMYHAVTIDKMNTHGKINTHIEDKVAFTEYEVLETVVSERFKYLNLIKLQPKTGRKHQLRKHLLSIGNPILGDKDYFLEDLVLKGKGMYLHASKLEFVHPNTLEKVTISSKLPNKFKKLFSGF